MSALRRLRPFGSRRQRPITKGLTRSCPAQANAAAPFLLRGRFDSTTAGRSARAAALRPGRALSCQSKPSFNFAVVLGSAWLCRPLNARGMRPSPLGSTSEAPDRERVTLAGAASCGSRASREDHAGAASNSPPQVVPSDLPAWRWPIGSKPKSRKPREGRRQSSRSRE